MQTLALNELSSAPASAADFNLWERAKCNAEIIGHPMYFQLLDGHVACLRVATPVDQLPKIDAQLAWSQDVLCIICESTGATMSDDEDEVVDSYTSFFDGINSIGFGPLVSSETERSLMEQVRKELKHELKQGYKEKIEDVREEILRNRRAGKLPGDTASLLKAWWQSHSKWPYPTEEDKAGLVHETGLQLKQINN
ncbi:hypothetical protein V6N13_058267 [Hibiscus sabdariffa]|uniref:ELK domain-containing protein n=1 Tax=Hibiscus sabdariffa TaxID=183260 RepID=A0ABR2GHN4_9ROSI